MLKIFHNSADYSIKLEDYLTQAVALTLLSSESLDVGFDKPINALFIELSAKNTNAASLSVQYFKNNAFSDVDLHDETEGFKYSGFFSWSRNQETEKKTTLHGLEKYWYKIKLSVDSSAMVIDGLNLVFSADRHLLEEYPNILESLPEGKSSFIGFHQSARNVIITRLRNQGYKIDNNSSYKKVDQFDILDYTELTEASKFLVLSKIFYWLSDAVDDKWFQKAQKFEAAFDDKINLYYLGLDKNNDGKEDPNEHGAIQFVRIERV